MDKTKLNYFIDLGLAVSFILVFITGVIKFPKLLPSLGIRYSYLPMNLFTVIHDWSGIAIGIFVLLHLILHWKWIVCMTKNMVNKNLKKCD
ncbi:DUF4405 domain-containing protein [Candidatus Woesearchaeota archaeon]|nr:DUF4405 domain-containing protein [Candidatus Woesearchaeota archaeon]